jgi:hypothetical protein
MRIEGTGKPPGCKLIRFGAELEGGIIRTISIRGDFLASPEEGFDRAERRLWGTAFGDLERTFDRLLAEEGVETLGINGAGLARVFREALVATPAVPATEPAVTPAPETAVPATKPAVTPAPETAVPAAPAAETASAVETAVPGIEAATAANLTTPAVTAADAPGRE